MSANPIDAALSHGRTVLATLVLILIGGAVAFMDIPKESEPDINIPIIYVVAEMGGISPEDAERLIARPLEQELRAIEGVKQMTSSGFEGGANVTLEFTAGFDADKVLSDVREKVDDAKPELPEEVDEPTVNEVNFSLFPVLVLILSGDLPERTLIQAARDLRDTIERIPVVLKVEIAGERDDMAEVIVDPVKLESYGIELNAVTSIMNRNNLLVAAGAQDTGRGRFTIKVPGIFETVGDIMNMPVVVDGDAALRVRDLTEVRKTLMDPTGFARVGGQPAIALEITKRTGENIIDTIEHVKKTVEIERQNWPEPLQKAVHISFAQDKSKDIRVMLNDLQNNVIAAVLLVMVVVIAALGWRSSVLVGIAIPGSFLTGILVLSGLGMTVNIVVLFALILAVGMLVDGAIVVTEFADRKMVEGEPRKIAYALAAKRMAWPIIASTATTLAAFLPLMFWPGVVGEFMKYLPMTLLATLSASLVMALIFVPTLGAYIGRPGVANTGKMAKLAGGENHDPEETGGFTGGYIHVLKIALNHPAKVLFLAFALLIGVQMTYGAFGKGVEFFPDVEPDLAKIQVRARGNLSVYEMDRLMREVELRILEIGEEKDEFDAVYLRTGKEKNSQESEDIIGVITLEFAHWQDRRKANDILAEIEEKISDLVGIIIDRRKQEQGPPVGKPVAVELSSRYPELLSPSVEKVLEGFYAIEGLINIEDSRPLPGIDWELKVDRAQAMKFNASVDVIGRAIKMASTGIKLGGYRPNDADEEIDIQVRYPVDYRTIDQLDQIRINTAKGRVPISNFVERVAKSKIGTVKRTDARRIMTVKSDVEEGMLVADKVSELQSWLKTADIDQRVKITFRGEDEEQKQAEAFLGKAFMVALFIMAIILVTQFNSFYSALLILTSVIMSTIGVFIGLLVTNQPFGIVMSGVGVIALAGIVVNNNIVLIDTYDRLKETATTAREAILRTGAQRLRPVMLTTVTTMLGLMPMVSGVNIDFISREVSVGAPSGQWWTQLATAIVFGLGFATVLTLVVTPSALMIKANIHEWRTRRREAKKEKEAVSTA